MQLGNDTASLAKRVSMFRDIPAPILGLLGAAAKWSEHRVGECICTSGANHAHAVITESAWLLAPGWQIDKGSHASACIYAGELLDRIPTNCWLEARHKHTSVCHIAADRFQRAVASWPELAIRVQSAAWTREDHLLRLNSHLAAHDTGGCIAAWLLELARGEEQDRVYATCGELALLSGVCRQTVGKWLTRFQALGAIGYQATRSHHATIQILDRDIFHDGAALPNYPHVNPAP